MPVDLKEAAAGGGLGRVDAVCHSARISSENNFTVANYVRDKDIM